MIYSTEGEHALHGSTSKNYSLVPVSINFEYAGHSVSIMLCLLSLVQYLVLVSSWTASEVRERDPSFLNSERAIVSTFDLDISLLLSISSHNVTTIWLLLPLHRQAIYYHHMRLCLAAPSAKRQSPTFIHKLQVDQMTPNEPQQSYG